MNIQKIREDFPLYEETHPPIYLDSSCVTQKPRAVLEAMNEYYNRYPSCGGRSGHRLGRHVTEHVDEARTILKKFFGAKKTEEILFTRNTTEGINLVARGLNLGNKAVLTTDKEHNSNLVPWQRLSTTTKTKHVTVPTDEGFIDLDAYRAALTEHDIGLVAINHVSNLDGIENPVKDLTKLAHSFGALVLIDGAQAAGHLPVDVQKLGVDFYAASGHKMLGPSGTGILYVKEEHYPELQPLLLGGDTVEDTWLNKYELKEPPHRYEAGLQNYAGMIGLGRAAKYLDKLGVAKIHKHTKRTRKELAKIFDDHNVAILNPEGENMVSIIPQHMPAHELSTLLDEENILTRAGAFCVHSYFNERELPAAVRFSPYLYNNEADIEAVREAMEKLRKVL